MKVWEVHQYGDYAQSIVVVAAQCVEEAARLAQECRKDAFWFKGQCEPKQLKGVTARGPDRVLTQMCYVE